MNLNYLQFNHYNRGLHKIETDNILLITPNERLTTKHLAELDLSSIPADLFQAKAGTQMTFQSEGIQVIEITSSPPRRPEKDSSLTSPGSGRRISSSLTKDTKDQAENHGLPFVIPSTRTDLHSIQCHLRTGGHGRGKRMITFSNVRQAILVDYCTGTSMRTDMARSSTSLTSLTRSSRPDPTMVCMQTSSPSTSNGESTRTTRR